MSEVAYFFSLQYLVSFPCSNIASFRLFISDISEDSICLIQLWGNNIENLGFVWIKIASAKNSNMRTNELRT